MPVITLPEFQSLTFDYLIVGGGTSGLALATILAEEPNVSVGVIEAGGYEPDIQEVAVPGLAGSIIRSDKHDWKLLTIPQADANGRHISLPRGKILGGTSAVNFNVLARASKDEYDAIEQLGNPGWDWHDHLNYMKKSEVYLPSSLPGALQEQYGIGRVDLAAHGLTGKIAHSSPTYLYDTHMPMFQSMQACGLELNLDPNSGNNVGYFTPLFTIDRRPKAPVRSYSASAYFEAKEGAEKLSVLLESRVTKILLAKCNNDDYKAIGVEVMHKGKVHKLINVKREVILSMGSLQTPQLLELSGIGNPNTLSKHGIDTLIDLPGVGENLQDHLAVRIINEIDPTLITHRTYLSDPQSLAKQVALYQDGEGILASPHVGAFAFVAADNLLSQDALSKLMSNAHASLQKNNERYPTSVQHQFSLQEGWIRDRSQAAAEFMQYPDHFVLPTFKPEAGKKYESLTCVLLHPFSRGSVHISSPDPTAPPAIDPRFLSNDADLSMLVAVFKFGVKLYTTDAIKRDGPVKGFAHPANAESLGEEDIKEFIRTECGPTHHPVGTASMLPRQDGGVVDPNLKVYGTENLRIVDLSILPIILSCHPQCTAYAIAEKAADILKEARETQRV